MKVADPRVLARALRAQADALACVAEALEATTTSATRDHYTQHDLPAWAPTRRAFLRAWRAEAAKGDPRAWKRGAVRGMTLELAEELARREPARSAPRLKEVANDVDATVLAELGLRHVGGGR